GCSSRPPTTRRLHDWSEKIICYTGLYKPNNRKYNHRLKQAAHSLALSHYRKNKVKARHIRKLLKTIKQTIAGGPA
ncbi:MAG: hypothetical protein QXG21_07255, partial [Candidatus Caldarchaeum sp.]